MNRDGVLFLTVSQLNWAKLR